MAVASQNKGSTWVKAKCDMTTLKVVEIRRGLL